MINTMITKSITTATLALIITTNTFAVTQETHLVDKQTTKTKQSQQAVRQMKSLDDSFRELTFKSIALKRTFDDAPSYEEDTYLGGGAPYLMKNMKLFKDSPVKFKVYNASIEYTNQQAILTTLLYISNQLENIDKKLSSNHELKRT